MFERIGYWCICVVLFIHTELCRSRETCTWQKIKGCVKINDFNQRCLAIDCIEKFIDSCDQRNRMEAEATLKDEKSLRKRCPGLPDGQCYNYEIDKCMAGRLKFSADKPYATDCGDFKRNFNNMNNCLLKIKKVCPHSYVYWQVGRYLSWTTVAYNKC